MGTIGRLLLRLILVPLGALVATLVCVLIVIVVQWNTFIDAVGSQPDQQGYFLAVLFLGPVIALAMVGAALAMLMPAVVGIAIAEAFAIRSFFFHVGNGVLSMWVGWQMIADSNDRFFANPPLVVAAGAGAGVTYWLIAGWTAGLRPVFGPVPGSPSSLRSSSPPTQPSVVPPLATPAETPPAPKPEL